MAAAHEAQLEELGWKKMNNVNNNNVCCAPPTSWAPSQILDLSKFPLKPPRATDGDTEAPSY